MAAGGLLAMRRMWTSVWLAAAVCGCGGQYVLTAPDQVAPAGGEASVVARLTRNEISRLDVPVAEAPLEFCGPWSADARAAFTDSDGFASVTMRAPQRPGRYEVCIRHKDAWGDQCQGTARLFAWDADRPAVAVAVGALPSPGGPNAAAAVRALARIAEDANILYLTREGVADHEALRARMNDAGYPDGPVLPWVKRRWRMTREGRWSWLRLAFDARMVGPLEPLRKAFPNLATGICAAPAAAKAFDAAGLAVVCLADDEDLPEDARRTSWAELPRTGLPTP
ncbi:MAG: hypothetical protein ACOC8F_04715 [Planctomycetota bacterium]